jgi:hypothetical protein
MNENVAHRYILNCKSVKEMRNVGKYIIKMTSEWENIYIYIYKIMGEQNEDFFRVEAIVQWYGNRSAVVEV